MLGQLDDYIQPKKNWFAEGFDFSAGGIQQEGGTALGFDDFLGTLNSTWANFRIFLQYRKPANLAIKKAR